MVLIGRLKTNLTTASRTRALASNTGVRRHSAARDSAHSFLCIRRNRPLQFLGFGSLGCWRVPVVNDLEEEDGIEAEASNEAVQNEWVVDFLQRGKDARKRSEEVVDDLQ